MRERWKTIPGFEGKYLASSKGRIRRKVSFYKSTYRGKSVRRKLPARVVGGAAISQHGYLRIRIFGKSYFVHQLVALAFLPTDKNRTEVNHKNGVRTDNRIENIEWTNKRENMIHAIKTGLYKSKTKNPIGIRKMGKKWFAKIYNNGREISLGSYRIKKEAVASRKLAEKTLWP